MAKTYGLGAVSLNGKAESAIPRESFSIAPQLQAELLHAGGAAHASFAGTLTSRPAIKFQTWNLKLLQEAQSLSGGGFVVSLPENSELGGFGATAISYAAAKGLAVPEQLTASKGQVATLSVAIYPVSADGKATPLASGTTKTLPGRITGGIYTLGSVKIGSTVIDSVTQTSINFGYNVITNEGENGRAYPTLARIDRHTPEVTVGISDLSAIKEAHILTGEVPAGSVTLYFSEVNEAGVPTGDKISCTLGRAFEDASGLQSGTEMTGTLRFRPLEPASGDFFAFGETSAGV